MPLKVESRALAVRVSSPRNTAASCLAVFILTFPLVVSCSGGDTELTSTPGVDTAKKAPVPAKEEAAPVPASVVRDAGVIATARPESGFTSAAGAAGWTTFRGTAQRTGRSDVAGPRKPRQKWVFRTGGRIWADATVSRDGETIYVASHDGNLYAVGRDGRKVWSHDAGGKIWTTPALGRDGAVYVGSDADRLIAIDPSGSERWVFSTEQPPRKGDKPKAGRYDVDTSPLVLADETVVFGCHTNLFALRPTSGGLRWMFEAGVGRSKIFSSPAMGHDGTIYFGTQGDFFFALNDSAKVLWHHETGKDNDSTAAVGDDGTVYFGSDDGSLRAMAPGGSLRWEAKVGAAIRAPLAIGHDGTIYASTYGKEPFLGAYRHTDGKELWRFSTRPGDGAHYGIQSGALVDAEGYIYFGGRDHYVYCLSPDGKLVWEYETGQQVDSSPVMGPDGTLYIGSDDTRLYAFER